MDVNTQNPVPIPNAPVVHSEIFRDGEVEYTLQIIPVKSEYLGRWFCLNCTQRGFVSRTYVSREEALRATRRHLKRHHSILHPRLHHGAC